jgi:hypothetical protein
MRTQLQDIVDRMVAEALCATRLRSRPTKLLPALRPALRAYRSGSEAQQAATPDGRLVCWHNESGAFESVHRGDRYARPVGGAK